MHCLQENRVILKLGSDKKSIYATRCCFKPEIVLGGLTFEQIEHISNSLVPMAGGKFGHWTLSHWCKDIFYNVPKDYDRSVFPKCQTTSSECDLLQMTYKNVSVNFSHACNLRCKHCFYDKYSSYEIQDIYFKTLESLQNVVCDISFTEEGEPFVDRERMLKILKLYKNNYHRAVHFISNMTLLDRDYIDKLHEIAKDTGVYYSFVASCDGITPETYKEIRRIDAFNKVIDNIKYIAEIGHIDNSMDIDGINFIVQPDNLHELFNVKSFFNKVFEGLGNRVNIIPYCKSNKDPKTEEIESQVLNSEIWKKYSVQSTKINKAKYVDL